MDSNDTSIVLRQLLDQIRDARDHQRADDVPPLVSQFIATAARRLEQLAHKVLRKYAPSRAGQAGDLFGASYERLTSSLQVHLPPASPADYFNIAATHMRYALLDMIKADDRAAGRATPLPSSLPAESTSPSENAVRSEFWHRFLGEVDRLDPVLRAVFDLHWTHGLPHAEVGGRLGLTEKQAKDRWAEVKVTLRRRLGD